MSLDSTANLLFNISANSDDAEGNIARFRSVMSKDLSDLGAEFESWSTKVFGSLTSVAGAMTAAGAAFGAAVVAATAYATSAADKYLEYTSEVGKGMKVTGLAAENMSALKYAGEAVGVQYDTLLTGLTRFSSTVMKAAEGSDQQTTAFARLGISQAQVKAGEQDLMPLLYQVADAFQNLKGGVDKTAVARELFSRGGADMLGFLNMGSAGLKKFAKDAEDLGLVLNNKDVIAAKEFKMALHELNAEREALDLAIGRETLPLLEAWNVTWIGLANAMRDWKPGALADPIHMYQAWMEGIDKAYAHIDTMMDAAKSNPKNTLLPPPEQLKEAKADFTGITSVIEQIRQKTDGTGDAWAKVNSEVLHLQFELDKAAKELEKMRADGKISPEALQRELAALATAPAALRGFNLGAQKDLRDKQAQEVIAAGEELQGKLTAQQDKGWQEQLAAWDIEIEKLREHLTKKNNLTSDNQKLLDDLAQAGRNKIERARNEAFVQELEQMQSSLASVITARMTSAERLSFTYDQDLRKYSQTEEEKSLKTARGEAERAAIQAQYAMNRDALLQKYGQDLTALQNSQGWQGVLGGQFGRLLKQDEQAWREWSTSADQAMLMVRLAGTALGEEMRQAFDNMGRSMGQNIAQAIVYQKSIGDAMRSALASTLESIAAESITQAIYSTALGFVRLAQHDYTAAGAAFEAAALFGSVGAVAAVSGRAVAPPQSSTSASANSSASAAAAGSSDYTSAAGTVKTGVHIVINGPVIGPSGIDELTGMINDAVMNRDVRLISTATRQQGRISV